MSPSGQSCHPCPGGTFSNQGATSCSLCSAGATQPACVQYMQALAAETCSPDDGSLTAQDGELKTTGWGMPPCRKELQLDCRIALSNFFRAPGINEELLRTAKRVCGPNVQGEYDYKLFKWARIFPSDASVEAAFQTGLRQRSGALEVQWPSVPGGTTKPTYTAQWGRVSGNLPANAPANIQALRAVYERFRATITLGPMHAGLASLTGGARIAATRLLDDLRMARMRDTQNGQMNTGHLAIWLLVQHTLRTLDPSFPLVAEMVPFVSSAGECPTLYKSGSRCPLELCSLTQPSA